MAYNGYLDPAVEAYYAQSMAQPLSCDIKPRLTKEQHDILESEFQKQSKPNTATKKNFADALNVSLDKINNWFQNRRAKSKQDAKKQAGNYNPYAQQQGGNFVNYDSDTSPAFASPDYFAMMQQCSSEDQIPHDLPIGQMPQFQEQHQGHRMEYGQNVNGADTYGQSMMPQHLAQNMFDHAQEMNRRTLTQEQFDAFAHNGGMMQSPNQFDALHHGFSGNADVFQQVFPGLQHDDFKQHDLFDLAVAHGAPLSSNDSSVPSTLSEQSMFPSSRDMQDRMGISAASSDFTDSRSSSMSVNQNPEGQFAQMGFPPHQQPIATSQWQPGQSIPVDPNALQQQFREVEQRQMLQQQQQQQQHEQPLAWPTDEAFAHSDTQSSNMLAQQMSSFAIQTPQAPQDAAFQPPAPPSSIAARRQRPRPAALGLASLRSQSYSGASQTGSPSHAQHHSLTSGQPLRRIRSSNVMNGVANGRVMKAGSVAQQRSPLSWTFADSVNSPKAIRHHALTSSMGNLAPPTPLSPAELDLKPQHSGKAALQNWPSSHGHFGRQPSISETDAEHHVPFAPSASVPPQQNFTSPPHTPMYHQHAQHFQPHVTQGRYGSTAILENTPPQSAPACQQSFPPNSFSASQPLVPASSHSHAYQTQQPFARSQSQQSLNLNAHEQPFPTSNGSFATRQSFGVPASAPGEGIQFQFANGVPVVNAQGQLTMAFPQQVQQMQPPPPQFALPVPYQQHTSPRTQYSFVTSDGISTAADAQMPKQNQSTEFVVHEYSPPRDMKCAATRKAVDTGPKNYMFANQGPEHFERSKKHADSKTASVASSSPAGSATF